MMTMMIHVLMINVSMVEALEGAFVHSPVVKDVCAKITLDGLKTRTFVQHCE